MDTNVSSRTQNTEQLTNAFHLFNALSENLTLSYQGLQQQVAKLHQELASARDERFKTLIEKEKLAIQLQTILAALPAAVVILDKTGQVIDCNAQAVELLNRPLLKMRWKDVLERNLIPVRQNPHEWQLKDGSRISITQSLLPHGNGQIIMLSDVSEMRALQDIVNQQQHLSAMGEMVASLAHQVRTPLSTAILYASQLAESSLDKDQRQRFSRIILERLHFLERQVNDMLIFAKDGRMTMETFSLPAMLEQVAIAMQDHIGDKNVLFKINNSAAIETMLGNEPAIRGAIMNLLENALTASDSDGSIKLTVRQNNRDELLITIEDNGSGIDQQHLPRIFEPFYTTRAMGTGLGLAVVNSVVAAHQGKIKFASRVGKGTQFHLKLPLQTQGFCPLTSNDCTQNNKEVRDEVL